jgi:hypothetical protein
MYKFSGITVISCADPERKIISGIFLSRDCQGSGMGLMEILWPLFFPILATIIAAVHIAVKKYTGTEALGAFLMWQLAAGFGLSLLWGGIGHLFFPDMVAQSIGWPTGSPFQREVGMWDAAIGIVGLLCLKYRDGFWTAMLTGAGIFSISAGLGHIWELAVNGNTAPNNAGAVMYLDILYPLFLAALLIWYRKKCTAEGTSPG